jgi:hypothetical protein
LTTRFAGARSLRVILTLAAATATVVWLGARPVASGLTHHVRVPVARPATGSASAVGWTSSNWSGYAITGGPFTAVTGSWTVPSVARSRKATYSSNWVGIDGFNDSALIQTGTEQDFYSGGAHYNAWWEILPAPETRINNLSVRPGDVMSASISQAGNGGWTISITDASNNESFTTQQAYSGPLTSAEWIEEAPTVNGRVATLAHYGSSTFDPGTANGVSPRLTNADSGAMIQGGAQVSTPSAPDSDVDGFNVAYGSAAPNPPRS